MFLIDIVTISQCISVDLSMSYSYVDNILSLILHLFEIWSSLFHELSYVHLTALGRVTHSNPEYM